MNINPFTLPERQRMIAQLADGLGPRAARTLEGLSDGHLRSIMEAEAARLSTINSEPSTIEATAPALQTR